MMVDSCTIRWMTFATGCALTLITALGDRAHAESLDASYTISFARIRVGDITATVASGDSEYAISANGRAGGVMKILLDGEGSFTTRGTITDGHPVPTNFTSKIVSNAGNSDVTMVLDEGSVKELVAAPLPSSGRVPVTEANRQGIVDPLTAMLFSAAPAGDGLSQQACRHTLPIFDGHQRYDLKLAFKRMDKVTAEKGYAGRSWCAPYATNQSPAISRRTPLSNIFPKVAKWRSRSHRSPARACWRLPAVRREHARKYSD